ncbi:MAG: amidophosphoribosyltransferase, partial [Planctomycetota bacterium]|nr:amidophosphoribosyltransferase [Planctomycetota bacterium]
GIIGIVGRESVATRLVKATERMQNRGEQSTGVATFDGSFFRSFGAVGSAALAFHGYDVDKLKGTIGIGHTRYATTGGDSTEKLVRNIQPVMSDRPAMALAANGDLINIDAVLSRLKDIGFSFQTEVDSKAIQNLLVDHYLRRKVYKQETTAGYAQGLLDCVADLHAELNGAYSIVCMTDRGLLVFKDPNGIRPLCMATRKAGNDVVEYAFASESSVFNFFGDYSDIRELEPGEAIFVDQTTLRVYSATSAHGNGAFCFFEFIYFARPDSKFLGRVVEVARKDLGRVLAEEYASKALANKFNLVVGVPSTALSAAHAFAQALKMPMENAIIRVGSKRSFQETSDDRRKKAIDEKFIFIKDMIAGKRIALIDDSNVRGTTARKIVQRLLDLDAKEVHYFFYCPPIVGPCFYGIDTPDETKLIAFKKNSQEISTSIGAHSVNYISVDGLIRGLKIPRERLCLACITRNYPTPVDEVALRVKRRNTERTGQCLAVSGAEALTE